MSEPMSDERLAEIRKDHAAYEARHAHAGSFACCNAHSSANDVPELLAEVERLRGKRKNAFTWTEWAVQVWFPGGVTTVDHDTESDARDHLDRLLAEPRKADRIELVRRTNVQGAWVPVQTDGA